MSGKGYNRSRHGPEGLIFGQLGTPEEAKRKKCKAPPLVTSSLPVKELKQSSFRLASKPEERLPKNKASAVKPSQRGHRKSSERNNDDVEKATELNNVEHHLKEDNNGAAAVLSERFCDLPLEEVAVASIPMEEEALNTDGIAVMEETESEDQVAASSDSKQPRKKQSNRREEPLSKCCKCKKRLARRGT